MKMVRPILIGDDELISTNVADSSEIVWDSTTIFTVGTIVYVAATHHEYETVIENTNVYPPDDIDSEIPKWIDLGATNRWRMFNNTVGSNTTNTGSIEVSILANLVNSVGLLNINGSQIRVEVVYNATTYYDKTINLVADNASDYYTYFFEPIIRKTDVVLTDLPTFTEATINITISNGVTESTQCGLCIIGNSRILGRSQWGASVGSVDYSIPIENQFGGYEILERAYSKKMEVDVFIPDILIDEVYRLLNLYRAVPMLWVGSDYTSTIMFGYRKDFGIVLSTPAGHHCSLTIQGLI